MHEVAKKTIMSQYANSPRLMKLIDDLADAIDPSKFTQDFYNMIMNLATAKGFGLDIWGRIVDISRRMTFPDPEGEFFGFEDGFYPFNQRPFSSTAHGSYELPDDAYRRIILIKAVANILKATAPNINRLLKHAFNEKKTYFLITGHMKARYVFEFHLTAFERHIVYNTDILPRPCGVEIEILDAIPPETFGFKNTGFQPFNEGTFHGRL